MSDNVVNFSNFKQGAKAMKMDFCINGRIDDDDVSFELVSKISRMELIGVLEQLKHEILEEGL